ncbi:MAG: hypothetical protein ACTHMR_13590 [Thermomicrobiales bacterium]
MMESEARQKDEQVIWCEPCGMPHARGTTHCISCGAPLGEAPAASTEAPAVLPASTPLLQTPEIMPAPPMPASATPARTDTSTRGRRSWRAAPPMSDSEVEATAAAIVARAMAAGVSAPADAPADSTQVAPPPINLTSDSGPLVWPDPVPPGLPAKDRLWLIAGVACCVILLLALIVFVRTMPYGAH